MRIGSIIYIGILSISLPAYCQSDTSALDKSLLFNNLRLAVGFEKNPFLEIGFSRLLIADKGINSGSLCFYGSGQVNGIISENSGKQVYGGKLGFETAWMIAMWGSEIKYLTNGSEYQWFFTPRVGLSLLGAASLVYGINLPTKSNRLSEVGRHQISFSINISKRLMRLVK